MKNLIVLIALMGAVSVNSQSLKEILYSGKLKNDTGSVVRKNDDLSTKIDSTRKVLPPPVEPEKVTMTSVVPDSLLATATTKRDSAIVISGVATKDNNKSWKDYMDELTTTLKTEVMPNKKIKDGTYSVLIEYEIGLDGQVSVNSVSASPESSFLEQQVKERITLAAPKLTPLLGANGKPRKAVKKQTITLAK